MAYRGDAPASQCYQHAAAAATTTCRRCLKAICEVCLVYDSAVAYCPPCARAARRQRTLIGVVGALAGVALLGGGITWVLTRPAKHDAIGVHHAPRSNKLDLLRDKLERSPCAHEPALELAETMLEAHDAAGALKFIDGFLGKCGDWPRLRWVRFSAHKEHGELPAAIQDATELIAGAPDDQDFWWWRGQVHQTLKHDEDAIGDFRQANVLLPSGNYIPFDLSKLLDDHGRPCEALAPVETYLFHHPEERGDGEYVDKRLRRLVPLCGEFYAVGPGELRLDVAGRLREKKARVNGKAADVAIDNQASFSLVSEALAKRLGLASDGRALTADEVAGRYVMLDEVGVRKFKAKKVEAVIVAEVPGGSEALLGQNFLAHFEGDEDDAYVFRARRSPHPGPPPADDE